jgi:hypothetical protein
VTRGDQDRLDRVRQLTDPARPVTVTHWLAVTRAKNSSVTKAQGGIGHGQNGP